MNKIKIALFKELCDVTARAVREKIHVSYYGFSNCA